MKEVSEASQKNISKYDLVALYKPYSSCDVPPGHSRICHGQVMIPNRATPEMPKTSFTFIVIYATW